MRSSLQCVNRRRISNNLKESNDILMTHMPVSLEKLHQCGPYRWICVRRLNRR